eukprot:TRINITY_DN53947_c0_g1_i1.p1 TRINITY_DN53947_c0_g1~~TRINITY_DN53947_c0_g1_i1.p1  ORF type:complete len:446 (-),score=63.80 TRINITY_DN53947_c0_g1_i1:41-1285(-)
MSFGSGTLASPGGDYGYEHTRNFKLAKGNGLAASSNGKQHGLPQNPSHSFVKQDATSSRFKWETLGHFKHSLTVEPKDVERKERRHQRLTQSDVEAHWDLKQPRGPTRLIGTVKGEIQDVGREPKLKLGGEVRLDKQPDLWTSGEYWNVDSNIRKWGEHEIRRNMAAANHDVHRHDQIQRVVLPPQPGHVNMLGQPLPMRQSVSGVITADGSFLEAMGFDLGLRDRQAKPVKLWRPANSSEMFRSHESYQRDLPRMTDYYRTMRRSNSMPGSTQASTTMREVPTLRPEDVGGQAGAHAEESDETHQKAGRTHGSRSCRYWDRYDHTCRREAAKMACGTFSPIYNSHPEFYPIHNLELSPAAVYTRKYQLWGEEALRGHESKKVRPHNNRARPWLQQPQQSGAEQTMRNTASSSS